MAVDLIGTIIEYLPIVKGTSQKGEWTKQDFILQTPDPYGKKICISDFNEKSNAIGYGEGAMVKVSVDIESRPYNDKWFTNVTAFRIAPYEDTPAPKQPADQSAGSSPYRRPANNDLPAAFASEGDDDLPF